MLRFAYKRFDGVAPEPGDPSRSSAKGLDSENRALLEKVEATSLDRFTHQASSSAKMPGAFSR